MPLTRREAMTGCVGGLAWLAGPLVAQTTCPSRAIKMIVPYRDRGLPLKLLLRRAVGDRDVLWQQSGAVAPRPARGLAR